MRSFKMKTLTVFLVSFLITYLSIPLFRKLAFRFEILDFPGGRKIHKEVTPLLGGMGIYLGLIVGLAFNTAYIKPFLPILIGATIVSIIGLVEDIKGLSAQARLLLQLAACLVVIGSGIRVSFLPNNFWGNIGEMVITVLWILGVTNAYNYLDGMDGLAAGSSAINLFFFAVILYSSGQFYLGLLSFVLMGACLGFLPYNLRKDKVFLGETGSTLLGFILAAIALMGNWAQDNLVRLSIPVLILGVPIFDMIFTTIMRIKEEKIKTIIQWLQYGGKDHFHHYLVDIGLKPLGAVVFIFFITISLGISAVMVSNDVAIEGLLTLSQAAIIFGVIATLIVVGKRRRSGWIKDKNT
jgi:UDP-GlcNAc:undecaprenyl-phosphate GlcNAc-1-phosphate transferase